MNPGIFSIKMQQVFNLPFDKPSYQDAFITPSGAGIFGFDEDKNPAFLGLGSGLSIVDGDLVAGGGGGSVSSVNGQTGTVVLDAEDVGAAPTFAFPVITRAIYVNKGGNDGTADGTPGLPFLTINAAEDSITDASASKIYQVIVGPGTYTEDVPIRAFSYLSGAGSEITVIDGTVQLADDWGINVVFGGVTDLYSINGVTGGIGGNTVPVGCAGAKFLAKDFMGAVNINWRDGGSFFYGQNWDCVFLSGGNATFRNSTVILMDSFIGHALVCIADSTAMAVRIYGGAVETLEFTGDNHALTSRIVDCDVSIDLFASGSSSCVCSFDSTSYPKGVLHLTNGATVALVSTANGTGYIPADPTKWNGSPATVQAAIDRIAAVVGNITPIP